MLSKTPSFELMSKVLVAGATGFLGRSLVPFLKERGHQVIQMGHTHLTDFNVDLTSIEETSHALDQVRPEVIINLIALTDVDRCETHPNESYLLNVKPVENLCNWIQTNGQQCHFIQISTDQLYDGRGEHSENVLTIRNHYAMSKLAGEYAARLVPSTILRTNFVGRSLRQGRTSFTDWIYEALHGTDPVRVFDDVMFSPLASSTLCNYLERVIIERPLGIFNLGSRDGMSKADFAFAFAVSIGLSTTKLIRSNASDVTTLKARRPTDMRMRCDHFEAQMRIKLPRLIDEIQVLANDYR
jgi:dTDP-4-dehydrorhamnose reductase